MNDYAAKAASTNKKVLKLCPSWKKTMTEGIPCIVCSPRTRRSLHSKETQVQLMLSRNQFFATLCDTKATFQHGKSWARVVEDMKLIKRHFAGCTQEAADSAAAWSSGDDSPGLIEAETFAKGLKVRGEPEDGQLNPLATAQWNRAPKWPLACLKTLLQAPDCFCLRH